MTYAEAAERLGIKPDSVKRRARSRRWPRRVGNDGAARVLKEARDDRDRWRAMAERLSHPEPGIIARLLGLGRGRRGRD